MTEREIFLEALELPTPESRAAYLQAACGGDALLHRKVEELLKEHDSNDSLLAGSALEGVRDAEARPPASEAPAQMIGRYKLLEKIGEGGFGEVWMAEQREPVKRRVALKIIKLGMDSRQVVARFEAERQALAMMDHPNIAKIFDAGTIGSADSEISNAKSQIQGGRPYFVMELVRGIKITEYCDQNQLSTRDRLKLFILVCQAIQHAHQKGIIHRDIKPSNILVTLHDGVPVPKVIDFGIAKATQQELTDKTVFTQFQQFIGTPAYISPEQAEMSGLDVDTRADIYSLGVLLYELLVGQTPFDAKEMMQGGLDALRKIIREKEPVRPSTKLTQALVAAEVTRRTGGSAGESASSRRRLQEVAHQLKGDLDWIVMKCLEKDRTRRYDTANGLAMDIQRHMNNEPVVARPPSAVYKLQKAWQRNKVVFMAGAAVAVALLVGTGVSIWQAIRATEASNSARKANAGEKEQRLAAQTAQQRSRRFLYAAEMNLAQQALKVNNLGRARQLLDRHRPKPGEEDLRGWEWRYLWQLTRGNAPITLTNRPTMQGFSVSFSPDGKRLAVGWWDGRVDLWDVPARRWIRALTDRERPHVGKVVFSPVRNLLAATSEPNVVTLYDLYSGRESILWRAPDKAEGEVRDLAFSQDGSRVVIYTGSNPEGSDTVWVVNMSSSRIESRHPAGRSRKEWAHFGAARLSPDNRRLYLGRSDDWEGRIQCIDPGTGEKLWEIESPDAVTSLDISPDGRLLASASGFAQTTIRLWDAATGELLKQLERHTLYVSDLAFTRDGRRLISSAGDQTIRFWDTSTWTETEVLRGHTDEAWAIAISEPAQLIASVSRDGDLKLWRMDEKRATDGYRRLSESLGYDDVQPLDHSRVLLLPPGQPPELLDLKRDSAPVSLPEIGSSTNVLGCFGANMLCLWNGLPSVGPAKEETNQVLIGALRGAEFVPRGASTLDSGLRPTGLAYNPARRLLAWSEGTSSKSLYLASLAAPGRRIELTNDVPGLVPFRFSEDGNYLAAAREPDILRVWNVESGQIVASINQNFCEEQGVNAAQRTCFAANGSVLVVARHYRVREKIEFYNLTRPDLMPRSVPGGFAETSLAVSPNGELVAASNMGADQVLLFDAAKGEWIDSFQGHLNSAGGEIAFSPDGRRLISSYRGREAVKLWDVGTRQELLTLPGADDDLFLNNKTRWSADGNVILAGSQWQAWSAPSWEEIEAAEAKDPPAPGYGEQGKTEVKQP